MKTDYLSFVAVWQTEEVHVSTEDEKVSFLYFNSMIGSKLLLAKKTWTSMCICVQAGGCLLY